MPRIKVDLGIQKYERTFQMMSSERFYKKGEGLGLGNGSVGTNHESVFMSFAPRYKPDVVAYAYKPSAGGSNRGIVSWRLRGEGIKNQEFPEAECPADIAKLLSFRFKERTCI